MSQISAPVRVSIDVTYACDLRCIHCRTNTGEIPVHIRKAMLSIEQLEELILALDRMRVFEITLTGGEPTMRKGFWRLLELVPQLENATLTVITNAVNLRKSQKEALFNSGLKSLRVSIDGTRDVFAKVRLVDAFDRVIENCRLFQEKIENFKVLTTVMTTNYHDVWPLVNELRMAGIRRQDLILVRAHGRGARNGLVLSEEQAMELYREVKDFRDSVSPFEYDLNLNAPYLVNEGRISPIQDVVMFPYIFPDASLAISATGDVTMSRLYSPTPIGQCKTTSIEKIWAVSREALSAEAERNEVESLRKVFWSFDEPPTRSDALLDRQVFEGYEIL